jgi:leader peptidase (prepilin peptidase) / N-methyltransferase
VSTAVVIACGVVGGLVGLALSVLIERVPDRRPILAPPFPEIPRAIREVWGITVIGVTAGLFAALAAEFDEGWLVAAFLVFAATLVALSAIDLRHYILPNRIVGPLAVASLVLLGASAAAIDDVDPFLRALGCGAGAFVAFTTLHLISPRALGFGDVKLVFVLGLNLGWLGVGETIVGLFLGFVYGAIIGVFLIATGIRSRKDHVPFGPFLAAGALTSLLVGDAIVDWYRGR